MRQRIDRAATGERLRERVALAVSAADVASHDEPLLPMPTVSPPVRPLIEAWSPLVISEAQPLVTRLFTWRHVVRVVTSTVDGLVDVRRHQIDDALLSGISIDRLLISIADGCEHSAVWSATLPSTVTFVSLVL